MEAQAMHPRAPERLTGLEPQRGAAAGEDLLENRLELGGAGRLDAAQPIREPGDHDVPPAQGRPSAASASSMRRW